MRGAAGPRRAPGARVGRRACWRRPGAASAVAVGPGLGRAEATTAAVHAAPRPRRPARWCSTPTACGTWGRDPERLRGRAASRRCITPHSGEAARLLGRERAAVEADRLACARELAERSGAVVVLKGAGRSRPRPARRRRGQRGRLAGARDRRHRRRAHRHRRRLPREGHGAPGGRRGGRGRRTRARASWPTGATGPSRPTCSRPCPQALARGPPVSADARRRADRPRRRSATTRPRWRARPAGRA